MFSISIKILINSHVQQCRNIQTSSTLLKIIPKNLKGKSKSSQDWLTRQLNDPYVKKAKREFYRARSAYKLLEINDKLQILKPGLGVVECGCSPGSWTQVIVKHCNTVTGDGVKPITHDPSAPEGRVVGLDLLPTTPIPGATFLANVNFNDAKTWDRVMTNLRPCNLDLVLSDMAPNAIGVSGFDHEKIMELVYNVAKFALSNAGEGSHLLCKVWHGGKVQKFTTDLSKYYESVKIIKPPCSRDNTSEIYVYASTMKKIKRNPLVEHDS